MTENSKNKILAGVRAEIDHIDIEIVKLLKKRTEKVLISRRLKTATEDLKRENEVLAKIARCSDSILQENFLTGLFREIMSESKSQQDKNPLLAAFCGEHGAFGEKAIRFWQSDWVAIAQQDIDLVLNQTRNGIFDYAVIALESTQGGIDRLANSLLADCGLFINGAVDMQINHCLLTLPETSYRDIRTVYSHPQAFSQCRKFVKRHNFQVVNTHDTGLAASLLSEKRMSGAGVIASLESAALYNLSIIKENVQDNLINRTRFLILGRNEQQIFPGKCSVIFDIEIQLTEMLKKLGEAALKLVRLESYSNQKGGVTIFADFNLQHSDDYNKLTTWLKDRICQNVQILGCYTEIVV